MSSSIDKIKDLFNKVNESLGGNAILFPSLVSSTGVYISEERAEKILVMMDLIRDKNISSNDSEVLLLALELSGFHVNVLNHNFVTKPFAIVSISTSLEHIKILKDQYDDNKKRS